MALMVAIECITPCLSTSTSYPNTTVPCSSPTPNTTQTAPSNEPATPGTNASDAINTTETSDTTTASETTSAVTNTTESTTSLPTTIPDTAAGTTSSNDVTTGTLPTATEPNVKQTTIIIVAAAATGGVVVGIVATIIVVLIIYKRKNRYNKPAKRLSKKRNFSYTVTKEAEDSAKAEPVYIQILPDPVGSSDDSSKVNLKLENLDNASPGTNTDRFKSEEDDYDIVADELKPGQEHGAVNGGVKLASSKSAPGINTDEFKNEEADYDIVTDEVKPEDSHMQKEDGNVDGEGKDTRHKLIEDDYSHINTGGRKISDTSYSHLNLDQMYANKTSVNVLVETENATKEDNVTFLNNTDDGYYSNYSNLDASIDIALKVMDKTIANFEQDETLSDRSDCSDNDIEEETYNHLGSLKMKNAFGQNKLNYGQKQKRRRSRSLPAEDLKPEIKAICDEIDMYDHLKSRIPVNEHTYCNWTPLRHAKSKSLPATQNLEYRKEIRKEADNYSHINLTGNICTPKRKNAIATMNPAYLNVDTKVSYDHPKSELANQEPGAALLHGYDFSVVNRVHKINDSKLIENTKQTVFTLQEGDSEDEQPHSYFVLEPSTSF